MALTLFDSKMQFRPPSAVELEAMTEADRSHFAPVTEAVEQHTAAVERRKQIESAILTNEAKAKANAAELAALPKFTATDNAKAWIAGQRAERARERGF